MEHRFESLELKTKPQEDSLVMEIMRRATSCTQMIREEEGRALSPQRPNNPRESFGFFRDSKEKAVRILGVLLIAAASSVATEGCGQLKKGWSSKGNRGKTAGHSEGTQDEKQYKFGTDDDYSILDVQGRPLETKAVFIDKETGKRQETIKRFVYDNRGVTVEIREIVTKKDKQGTVLSVSEHSDFFTPVTKKSTFVYKDGKSNVTSVIEDFYQLNEKGKVLNGNRTAWEGDQKRVAWTQETTFEYNEDGKRTRGLEIVKDGTGHITATYEGIFTYDVKGNRLTEKKVSKNGLGEIKTSEEITRTYADDDQEIGRVTIRKDDKGSYEETEEFGPNERLKRRLRISKNTAGILEKTNESLLQYDEDWKLKEFTTRVTQYDKFYRAIVTRAEIFIYGNKVGRALKRVRYVEKEGKKIMEEESVFEYNTKNERIKEVVTYHDPHARSFEIFYKYIYANGKLIKIDVYSVYDDAGIPEKPQGYQEYEDGPIMQY